MQHTFTPFLTAIAMLLAIPFAAAQDTSTRHENGLRRHPPRVYALTEARIVQSVGKVIEQGSMVIRDGKLVEVGSDVTLPENAQIIDMSGKTIYPGFIDSYGEVSLDAADERPATGYWNDRIRADFDVSSDLKKSQLDATDFRKQGFVARLIAPEDGIIRGVSAIYSLGENDVNELLLQNQIALHGELTIPRRQGDRDDYPNSPMGAVALARQSFYDARWYREAHRAVELDPSLPVPEQNVTLQALGRCIAGDLPLILETSNELFAVRADDFAREFQVELILVGSGNEYRRLDEIAGMKRPIIVPVAFPDAPNVGSPEEARRASLESLMHWDHAPENLARLEERNVEILLSAHRLEEVSQFLKNLRIAVKRGLSADAALAALTSVPARRFQIDSQLGSLTRGKLASFVVTDGELFAEDAKILETWVDGHRYRHDKNVEIELAGDWKLTFKNNVPVAADSVLLLNVTGKDKLKAKVRPDQTLPKFKDAVSLNSIAQEGSRLVGQFPAEAFGSEGMVLFSVVLEQNSDQWLGTLTWPTGAQSTLIMTSNQSQKGQGADSSDDTEPTVDTEPEEEKKRRRRRRRRRGDMRRTPNSERFLPVFPSTIPWGRSVGRKCLNNPASLHSQERQSGRAGRRASSKMGRY